VKKLIAEAKKKLGEEAAAAKPDTEE